MPNRLVDLCVEKGMRMTEQRRVIARVLSESDDHPDVEQVYQRATKIDPRISIATVYRTLTLFNEIGVATKFEFGDGKARYELVDIADTKKHHHVLVCEMCFTAKKYSDFTPKEKQNFEQLEQTLSDQFDFSIQRHVVHYYGVCSRCRG